MSYVLTPQTVEQAVQMLAAHPGARPMSGGASLVAMKNARLVEPDHVVSLAGVAALRGIARQADGGLRIGGMARHRDLAGCELLTGDQAMIRQAAGVIANRVVRNMGTIGGAVGNADPAADYLPVLACAGARVEIAGPGGLRHLTIAEYLVGWYETALQPGEFVAAVVLPPAGQGASVYRKLARTPGDYATVSVACARAGEGVRVAVGACGPAPLRAEDAEAALAGRLTDPAAVAAFGAALAALADPIDDVRGSADYRRRLIPRMVAAAIGDVTEGA
jgi:CO/xanthine dehydrogenase FAD-binding subunit